VLYKNCESKFLLILCVRIDALGLMFCLIVLHVKIKFLSKSHNLDHNLSTPKQVTALTLGVGVDFVTYGGRKPSKVLTLEVEVKFLHVLALFLLKCCFKLNSEQSERKNEGN